MGRRLTRKQIKQDEFITIMDRVVLWLSANWRQAAMGLGGAVALGLLWWALSWAAGSRSAAATKALDEAVAIFQAKVGQKATGEAKFATEDERRAAALKALAKVRHYWFTPQARLARILQARLAMEKGETAKAEKELAAVAARGGKDPVVRLATLDLLHLRLAKGESAQVIKELEAMASGKDKRLPQDEAMLELAKAYQATGNERKAGKILRELLEKFPDSPWQREAQQRFSSLS